MTETMSRAEALYPRNHRGEFPFVADYYPIIHSFGTVLTEADIGSYQGDTVAILQDDAKGFGFLVFSFGSCCVCDALQACGTYAEIDELINSLENGVRWFSSLQEAKDYVMDDEMRKGSHCWHEPEWVEFKHKVQSL
jgi:hypothetical protein